MNPPSTHERREARPGTIPDVHLVRILKKCLHPPHAALCDMMWNSRNYYPRQSRHGQIIRQSRKTCKKIGIVSPIIPLSAWNTMHTGFKCFGGRVIRAACMPLVRPRSRYKFMSGEFLGLARMNLWIWKPDQGISHSSPSTCGGG